MDSSLSSFGFSLGRNYRVFKFEHVLRSRWCRRTPASPLPVFLSHDSIFNSLLSCISYGFFQLCCSGSTVNTTGRDLRGLILLVGVHQSGPLLQGLLDNCFRRYLSPSFHPPYGIPFPPPDLFLQSLIRLCCLLNTLTFSTRLSYILSSLAWKSGKTCYGEEQSPPPTCLDGHLACSGELCKYQPTTALCLSAGDFLAASDSYSRSTTSLANEPAAIGPRFKSSWAWPSTLAEAASPVINLLKSRNLQHIVSQSILVLVSLVNLKSFDGFIEVFFLSLLQYHSLRKQFLVDSPDLLSFSSSSLVEDRILQSCLHSMNGDVLSDPFPSYCFSLLTSLFPCVAVCTGPEGAIKITSNFLVGEGCLSTSLVTKSQLSDFAGNALSTHSSHVSNSLSTSYDDLLCLIAFAVVVYGLFLRGCLIPYCHCSLQV
ncbi:hypothetical protein F2Q68_00035865 [Brassica cretica]|uniref:Uncharacterized protein n=1 Tax=Brassica cretica TaxID=69181 RepID=A0A8S9H2L3_BRACR|nr:hypothetical protein F2Q68_00035865 [Brassica cretica]